MSDSAVHLPEPAADPVDAANLPNDDVVAGFQPPARSRYRPSEAWALRWLGPPAR